MKVKIMKLDERAHIPSSGSACAAGYDLYACLDEDVRIAPNEMKMIGTGLCAAIPDGYFGGIFARSGLAVKEGLRPANCVGVVDSDYRGEIRVALYNDSDKERLISHGERIAQLLILPYLKAEFDTVTELDETERGAGGFGHSGKN